jgi:hypothetical protein
VRRFCCFIGERCIQLTLMYLLYRLLAGREMGRNRVLDGENPYVWADYADHFCSKFLDTVRYLRYTVLTNRSVGSVSE